MTFIPEKYDFAFLVIDDTDCAELPMIEEIYDLLFKNGLRTNKTVWVYPPRDYPKNFGDSLSNPKYASWVRNLQSKGFEIGLHNVGSGKFTRDEILLGLEKYKEILGDYPNIHVNHSYNADNIYSGEERFGRIFNRIISMLYPKYKGFKGSSPTSVHFWGDVHKERIKYSRNIELPTLDLNSYFNKIPFVYRKKQEYSNYWYPATFAPNPWLWNKKVNPRSIDRLRKNRGAAIVYTHFGYYHLEHGYLDPEFRASIDYLGKQNGWYVTLSEFLDYQLTMIGKKNLILSEIEEFYLDLLTLFTRFKYRHLQKLDDLHFKNKVGIDW